MFSQFATNPKRLAWALPTVFLIVVTDWALQEGLSPPFPFALTLVGVVIAGAFGGAAAGILAGFGAAYQILYFTFMGFATQNSVDTPLGALLGCAVFIALGAIIGVQRDRNGALVTHLQNTRKDLEKAVIDARQERDHANKEVTQRDDQMRQAMRLSGVGFFSWNTKTGNCEFCTAAHAAHFGLSVQEFQIVTSGPEPYTGFVHEDDRADFLKAVSRIDEGEALPFDYRVVRPCGEIRYIRQINEPVFDEFGAETSVVGSSIDFTELVQAQENLRRAQRIEAVGNLTGGVAHDFNNLLAIILGSLELSLLSDEDDEKRSLIEEAIKATNRGAGLTRNLLSFSRRAHLTPKRLKLNTLVNTTINWSSRVLPKSINIETSLFAGLWDTELDLAAAESALINLLLNARDAMPEGGKLTIETANMRIEDEYIHDRNEEIEPGRYVMLAISDTGHGIDPDKLDLVFEPFYTEKPLGEGTGLGLSMVQGFVKQSKGAIRVYSEKGVGTTFKLYLRAAEALSETGDASVPVDLSGTRDGCRILMAEDDESVAHILKSMLDGANHAVSVASSGDEAFKLFNTSGPFDVLLTDIVMPGTLQGPALAKAIRTLCPDIPCIFLSGYSSEAMVHGNGLAASDIRLMKPVSRTDLLNSVDRAWAVAREKNGASR